jgi:hypothetical protein
MVYDHQFKKVFKVLTTFKKKQTRMESFLNPFKLRQSRTKIRKRFACSDNIKLIGNLVENRSSSFPGLVS